MTPRTRMPEVRLDTRIDLQRADLNQVRQFVAGLEHDLKKTVERLAELRVATVEDLVVLSEVADLIREAELHVAVVVKRLETQSTGLEVASRAAAELHVAAYGAPA